MTLKSTDWARLIQTASIGFCNVGLGKTQINKILFYVYGVYLAKKEQLLFTDDFPQAWTYGPVFPIVYRKVDVDRMPIFTDEEKNAFKSNNFAFELICKVCKTMPRKSAIELTEWSHEEGSPWSDTIYHEGEKQSPWGTRISDDVIKKFFENEDNRIFEKIS